LTRAQTAVNRAHGAPAARPRGTPRHGLSVRRGL